MFKRIDRGMENDLVVLPGWAFDWRIFEEMELPFNYLVYCGGVREAEEVLDDLMGKKSIPISIFGWSIGAFLASDFAVKKADKVNKLFLSGVREGYPKTEIAVIERFLKIKKDVFLRGFYKQVFHGCEADKYEWFRDCLEDDYVESMRYEDLKAGLEYLGRAEVDVEGLKRIDATFIHGRNDEVAPVEESRRLAELSGSRMVELEEGGHVPFLANNFSVNLCL